MKQNNTLWTILVCLALLMGVTSVYAAQSAVDLGTAGNFVILAKSGISTTGTTSVTGNLGVSPIDSTAITGFGLILDSSNVFASSSLVTGQIYAADYSSPTPTALTTAVSDMQIAYTDAAGRNLPDYTELGAGNIDGMTLAPGLYKWGTGVTIPNGVTLSGGSNDVWIFQIAQSLDLGNGAKITLAGGAQAKNIFWQVADQTTLGTTSVMNGNILDQTAIVFNTGARLNGRALAQSAVTLDASDVSMPSASAVVNPPSGGSGSGGSTGGGVTTTCTSYSTCSAQGKQMKTCTSSTGKTSVVDRSCTPVVANPPANPVIVPTQSTNPPVVIPAQPGNNGGTAGTTYSTPGIPLWAKIVAIVAVLLALVFAAVIGISKPKRR